MKKQHIILIVALLIILIETIYIGYDLLSEEGAYNLNQVGVIENINGTLYNNTLTNYYDIFYKHSSDELEIKIRNPCLRIEKSIGDSMKPFWENENLNIIDYCFPKERLKIGDVVIFKKEFDRGRVLHRIIDIDYNRKWIRTQGDNNLELDDFKSFDYIDGKIIGVLNVLQEKKIVKREILNVTNSSIFFSGNLTFVRTNQTCVCSSSGFLSFCSINRTQILEDTFIQQNDLKEEYCR